MPESFITQCPHCGTSFRVKEEHLAVANGSVRCGACLQVFSAKNHLVTSDPAAHKTVTNRAVAKPYVAPTAAATVATPTPPKLASSPPGYSAPVDPQSEPPAQSTVFEADDDDDTDFIFREDSIEDEEFLFQDDDDDRSSHSIEDNADNELGEFSDSFLSLDKSQTSQPFQSEKQQEEPENNEQDETWAESILEELEREDKRVQRPEAGYYSAAQPDIVPSRTFALDDDDFETVPFAATNSHASRLAKQLNQEIDLDFSAEERLARWRWLGALITLLLLLTLAGQFAWLQKDTYARMDQWRGLYETACGVIGCTLPAQIDTDQIRTSNVLVRDHRSVDGVQLVDAILTNRAAFRQPFPTLIIQYTDVNGQLVADQAFTPDHYLRGEMTGSQSMPINTRIYVSIPIRDPGQRAVNYQLLVVQQDR